MKLEIASFTVHAWLIAFGERADPPRFFPQFMWNRRNAIAREQMERLTLLVKRIIEITPGASAAFTPIYLHPI